MGREARMRRRGLLGQVFRGLLFSVAFIVKGVVDFAVFVVVLAMAAVGKARGPVYRALVKASRWSRGGLARAGSGLSRGGAAGLTGARRSLAGARRGLVSARRGLAHAGSAGVARARTDLARAQASLRPGGAAREQLEPVLHFFRGRPSRLEKRFLGMILFQLAAFAVGFAAALAEIESIVITGPVISLVGFVIAYHAIRHLERPLLLATFGLSASLFSYLVLVTIASLELSPREAAGFVPVVFPFYCAIATVLALRGAAGIRHQSEPTGESAAGGHGALNAEP